MSQQKSQSVVLKWTEIYSLAALSSAVAISWIAYHEYQPHLLRKLNLSELSVLLVLAKGIVLVAIPPIAGWLSDYFMRKTGKLFMVFTIGISLTAMAFMAVASISGAGALSAIQPLLPYMIVLWLISMNIFTSPALSMIDSFSSTKKLPIVVGFLFFVTQMIYALEPVIVDLVQFFGDTITFVVGGILIAGTGYVFQKVSGDEVDARKREIEESPKTGTAPKNIILILALGFVLGTGNGFLIEFVPIKAAELQAGLKGFGEYLSVSLLGFSAIMALTLSGFISRRGFKSIIRPAILLLIVSLAGLITSVSLIWFVLSGVAMGLAFALINVSTLPYVISKLNVRHITLGVGLFIGSSYVIEGLLEFYYL